MNLKFKRVYKRITLILQVNLGFILVALLGMSLRFRVVGREKLQGGLGKKGFIINTWHGQQLIGFYFFRGCGYYILSSLSRDGDYSSGIMRKFGWRIVRGSSFKGAVQGLIELMKVLRQGGGIALTPDGPRGPIYHIEPGGLFLAQKTGAPLIPVAFVFDRKWVSGRSWDKFEVPKPFARCVAYFGEPLVVTEKLTGDQMEIWKQRLRQAIDQANLLGEEVLKEWLNEK